MTLKYVHTYRFAVDTNLQPAFTAIANKFQRHFRSWNNVAHKTTEPIQLQPANKTRQEHLK